LSSGLFRASSLTLLLVLLAFAPSQDAQQRFESGPYKGFVREEPELDKVEIGQPFEVPTTINGIIVHSEGQPVSGALFEIRDGSGRVLSSVASDAGRFQIAHVRPGTYDFKVTKNGFHSVIGTITVSRKTPQKNSVHIQLSLGT
jgi:hypothetical protein